MRKSVRMYAVLWSLLWWPTLVHSQPNNLNIIGSDPTSVNAEYDGIVICFRCDVSPNPENRTRCEQEGHQPLLKRAEGHTHTLIGSTNKITTQLASDELHGKSVHIKGLYYPKANYILVSEASLRERGSR
ncbi:MAG: hypothetical protein AB7P69_20855 [Candidatus Binatia bacterium]